MGVETLAAQASFFGLMIAPKREVAVQKDFKLFGFFQNKKLTAKYSLTPSEYFRGGELSIPIDFWFKNWLYASTSFDNEIQDQIIYSID